MANAPMNNPFDLAETDLAIQLLQRTWEGRSIVLTPPAISLALATLCEATRGEAREEIKNLVLPGATDEELFRQFRAKAELLGGAKEDGFSLSISTNLFVKKYTYITRKYLDSITEWQANARNLDFDDDFAAMKEANEIVCKETNGQMPEVVGRGIFCDAYSVLVSGAALNAKWAIPFERWCTEKRTFHVDLDEERVSEMMVMDGVTLLHADTTDLDLVLIPYKNPVYNFVLILPRERFGFPLVRSTLTAELLQSLMVEAKPRRLKRMGPLLESLGLETLFSEKADLSGVGQQELHLDDFVHATLFEIQEGGTVPAENYVREKGAPSFDPPYEIDADHPFIFAVAKGRKIIMLGQVADSRGAEQLRRKSCGILQGATFGFQVRVINFEAESDDENDSA